MDWLILVDLDLNMELAKGFGREMKTPRPGDGGMGWDGGCWFCAGEWDSEWCVRKKREKSAAGGGEWFYARGQRSE